MEKIMSFFRVMSFNVLDNSEDPDLTPTSPDSWPNRAEFNIQTIKKYRPDLIGFQEFCPLHRETYKERFPEYEKWAANDLGGIDNNAIFFKTEKFELLERGNFSLTRTPDTLAPDWGLDYALTVHWMLLRERETRQALLFMNAQYEDGGDPEQFRMRQEGCQIQLHKIDEISARLAPGAPVVIMGDFNFHAGAWHHRFFLEHGFVDSYRAAGLPEDLRSSTFHGFRGEDYFALDYGFSLAWRVDWILYRDGAHRLQTVSAVIARDSLARPGQGTLYPSDHYPVLAEFIII
jgi:endonuclease/exonuclease/phosphatase family metal-dependent hydrolase